MGLFLLQEKLILHTAHQYKTAQEAYRRIADIVTNYDWFRRKVKRIVRTNGEEAIELTSGRAVAVHRPVEVSRPWLLGELRDLR